MRSLRVEARVMEPGGISKRHLKERAGQTMAQGSQAGYMPTDVGTASNSKNEAIGHIRSNGMRYAGQMPDGTEVIHTPIDFKAQSTVMTFNQAARKVKSEEICGYPAGTLSMPSQDQLDVIRLSYSQEDRNAIGPVWSRKHDDYVADIQYFDDGYRVWGGRYYRAQACFVPEQQP